jgi:hypothetical protein
LFKKGEIDYIDVAEKRLHKAWLSLKKKEREQLFASPLISSFAEGT